EPERLDPKRHLRGKRLVALQLAVGHRLLYRHLDLALGMNAHRLQELADAHVEGVFVHGLPPAYFVCVVIAPSASLSVSSGSAFTLMARMSASVATVCGSFFTSMTATNWAAAPATRSRRARSAIRISISLLSMKPPVFCNAAVMKLSWVRCSILPAAITARGRAAG